MLLLPIIINERNLVPVRRQLRHGLIVSRSVTGFPKTLAMARHWTQVVISFS
jgi:hypothetical protein